MSTANNGAVLIQVDDAGDARFLPQFTYNGPDAVVAPTGYTMSMNPSPLAPTVNSKLFFVYEGDAGQNSQNVHYRVTFTGGTLDLSRNAYWSYPANAWLRDDQGVGGDHCQMSSLLEFGQGDVAFFVAGAGANPILWCPAFNIEYDGYANSGNPVIVMPVRTRFGRYTGPAGITATQTASVEIYGGQTLWIGAGLPGLAVYGATDGYFKVGSQASAAMTTSAVVAFIAQRTVAGNPLLTALYDGPDTSNGSYQMYGIDTTGGQIGYGSGGTFVSAGHNGTAATRDLILHNYDAASIVFATANTKRGFVSPQGSFVLGTAALATSAVNGFTYLPTCAGTPTGTPTAQTGTVPMVVDTNASKLWCYLGGAWKGTVLA